MSVGTLVRVPLQGRRVRGWVVAIGVEPETPVERLRPLLKVASEGPTPELVDLAAWAAWRWAGSSILFLRAASPPNRVPPGSHPGPPRRVGPPQRRRPPADQDVRALASGAVGRARGLVRWPPALRMAELLRALVADEGSTIVVVPDGRRARMLVEHLGALGFDVVALGAGRPAAERTHAWQRARAGDCVVVGGRVALWAPVPDLAAVVVVDEGDEAQKEERVPAWHARELALERVRRLGGRVTLVTPAPTLEALVTTGHADSLPAVRERAGWPRVEIVDRRAEPPGTGLFSPRLVEAVRRTARRARAICVLNRRGVARLLACAGCGLLARCDRCGAAMTEEEMGLACPVCQSTRPVVCAECGTTVLRRLRPGVTRLRDELAALVPGATVAAVDARTEEVPRAEVLVGTESVLHRVGRAEMVAFLDFDQELLAPRFRAFEQALWLLVRAARIVGPREGEGRVLVQTRLPQHEVLVAAARGEPGLASEAEKQRRRELGLPPFTALAEVVGEAAPVEALVAGLDERVEVLGPSPSGGSWRALVRAPDVKALCDALADAGPPARTRGRLRIDVDPLRV